MRWTRLYRQTCGTDADSEAVWSWHPWAGVKCVDDDLRATVTNKVMDTGESTEQAINHRAGNVDVSASSAVTTLVCFLTSHTRLRVQA